jgi:predicted TIM-barrel fold metal-dependent hydrolase
MNHEKRIPDCAGPVLEPTRPSWKAPPGSWDTIFHVLGPQEHYPYWQQRMYTPPTATLGQYFAMLDVLGIENGMVAHATTQGPGNEIYLDAVSRASDRLVAAVKLDQTLMPEEAQCLHGMGVRGVRFGFHPMAGGRLDKAALDHVVSVTRELGWFIQMHVDNRLLPELQPWIETIPANVVLDHFGRVDISSGLEGEGVRALLALARRPHVWIKMSGADRVSLKGYPYDDLKPLAGALIEIAPDRLLWGTDWPHTGYLSAEQMPDDGLLFEAFVQLVPCEEDRVCILRDNPRRLLGLGHYSG